MWFPEKKKGGKGGAGEHGRSGSSPLVELLLAVPAPHSSFSLDVNRRFRMSFYLSSKGGQNRVLDDLPKTPPDSTISVLTLL